MIRPASIVRFEQFYLGSLVLGLVNTAISWSVQADAMRNNPQVAQLGTGFVYGALAIGVLLVIGTSLLLWFFTARQGSAITKWIITVLAGLWTLIFLFGLFVPQQPPLLSRVLGVIALGLDIASVVCLFRPDTRAWFGEKSGGAVPPPPASIL